MLVRSHYYEAKSGVLLSEEHLEDDVEKAIESICSSQIEVEYVPGRLFTAIFQGASLLSFNAMLNFDPRTGELRRYRAACHHAAERAVGLVERQFGCERTALPGRLSVSLYRSGVESFDNDEMPAACKFLIDGFKTAGLLQEGDSSHIMSFDTLMQRCGAGEPASICITFRRAYKS